MISRGGIHDKTAQKPREGAETKAHRSTNRYESLLCDSTGKKGTAGESTEVVTGIKQAFGPQI